jgi:hypothetical protein
MLTLPLRSIDQPAFRWKPIVAVGLVILVALLFIPQTVQRVHADAFVEAAAATRRSYLGGHLPMEIHTSSPTAVTAWFTGTVPFHYAALTTYEMQNQKSAFLLYLTNRPGRRAEKTFSPVA